VNLTEWAEQQGISKFTAYRWLREGKLPVPVTKVGRLWLVNLENPAPTAKAAGARCVVYARVSSADQKPSLDSQVANCVVWATQNGHSVDQVVTEVGSGLNGHRAKFTKLLKDPSVGTIIVEHRDRAARFGVEHLEAALSAQNRKLAVIDEGELQDDLVRDMTDVLTSFCARLYGKRGAKARAKAALKTAETTDTAGSGSEDSSQ
jgi:predicted site-specific integrase-resolvase